MRKSVKSGLILMLLAATGPAMAASCPTVNLTFNGTGGFEYPIPTGVNGGINPCNETLGDGSANKAYPACLTLAQDAIAYLESEISGQCTGNATIQFGAGQTYDFSNESTPVAGNYASAALDLSALTNSAGLARLVFQGSITQRGEPATTLVFNNNLTGFYAQAGKKNPAMSHITIADFVWQLKQDDEDAGNPAVSATIDGITYENSQGTFVGFTPNNDGSHTGILTLDVTGGFPNPLVLFDPTNFEGRFLRVYNNSRPAEPLLDANDPVNGQLAYGTVPTTKGYSPPPAYCQGGEKVLNPLNGKYYYTCAPTVSPTNSSEWSLVVSTSQWTLPTGGTVPDPILCIKSKTSWAGPYMINGENSLGGNASQDIVMDHVAWVTASRGLLIGVDRVQVTNASIARLPRIGGQAPCIANSAGGPQIGDIGAVYATSGNLVNHLVTEATGDNAVAIFNDTTKPSPGGTPPTTATQILNSVFDNSYSAPILLYNTPAFDAHHHFNGANVYVADPTSRTNNAPNFSRSGNKIGHCDAEANVFSPNLRYPFDNPTKLRAPSTLCGIFYNNQH